MTYFGDVRNKSSIIKGPLWNICAANWPIFCEHIFWQPSKGFTKCEICIFWVAMLPCDGLIWMQFFQICHFPGKIVEFTAFKSGENVLV